jgi:F-type H+-transporting ATPase subunit b
MIADLQQQLGIDSTFFPQIVLFAFVFVWMKFFFFAPYLKLITKREEASQGRSEEAQRLEEEAVRLSGQYQEVLSAARKKAFAEREALLATARKLGSDQVSAAREEAKVKLDQAREASEKSSEAELSGLRGQVGSISGLLVDKLMNTKVGL